eukprot:scaffold1639_cov331-Pavlova_lutheri.AAC.30
MELRCNINCGGGERKHNNNIPQRSAQRSRAPRRHERTSERARTHADATTLVVFAPQEKEVGAQAPHRSTSFRPRVAAKTMAKKKVASEGRVGIADGQRPLAAPAVVAVGNADAERSRARPERGAVPPRTAREGFVEEANEKEREMASKATLAAPTSQQKKPRASGGGREANEPVRTPTALAMASPDDGALEGFETLEHRGKNAKRSVANADFASSDARKMCRASEVTW